MSSVAQFRRSVDVFVRRSLSPQAQAKMLADTAKKGVADLIATGRASPDYRRYVDGREGVPEESVKPDGVIVYRFNQLGAITTFALSFLVNRSPIRSGDYRKSFYIGVNGKFIPMAQFNPNAVPPDAEIVIGNTQPYSRKVDVQLVGTRKLSFSVPAGLFDDAAQAVRRRYGALVDAKRVYTMRHPHQYTLKRGRRAGKPVESPAIIIKPR